ncbi:hypothetical protein MD484_g282, partial [Candolleomyces efflorescens]
MEGSFSQIRVIKRDGRTEGFSIDKLYKRIVYAVHASSTVRDLKVLAKSLADLVAANLQSEVTTFTIDRMASEMAAQQVSSHFIYGGIASAIERGLVYKMTRPTFSDAMLAAEELLTEAFLDLVGRYHSLLDPVIDDTRDDVFNYMSLRTLQRTYLLSKDGMIMERPQHMFMRVALHIHGSDIDAVKECYRRLSTLQFTFSTPTLYNSGTKQAARPSIRALPRVDSDSDPRPMAVEPLLVFLLLLLHFLPFFLLILVFLRFWGLINADLISMQRVEADGPWTLFCPSKAPQLIELYGRAFSKEYENLERRELGVKTVRARDLWKEIIRSQVESGGPSILFKDTINRTSNDRHLGTITQGNLCTEIVQFASSSETAVCTLASVVLPTFVTEGSSFNYAAFEDAVRHVVLSLNRLIHTTRYPVFAADRSASTHRAIGIGVQGLADVFGLMGLPFDSDGAFIVNRRIAETLYYAAVDESCNLIKTFGVYPSFKGSPADEGWLHFDSWSTAPEAGRHDWDSLRIKVSRGMCNSHVVAYMPTAGTSQFTQCSEGFEPFSSLIYTRKVLSGQYTVVNKLLAYRLSELGLWTDNLRDAIIASDGSVQHIDNLSAEFKALFKTVWEIDPGVLVRMAADRAPFVCQSQSMSLYFAEPDISAISRSIFRAWKQRLKTGVYYLRTRPASKPLPITLPVELWSRDTAKVEDLPECASCGA